MCVNVCVCVCVNAHVCVCVCVCVCVNAGQVFTHMMRKLLGRLQCSEVSNFMDDILIATASWSRHLEVLKKVLQRLDVANLSARPSKCFVATRTWPIWDMSWEEVACSQRRTRSTRSAMPRVLAPKRKSVLSWDWRATSGGSFLTSLP